MGYSGDAAEEVVKMTLDGAEFVIRLGGKGAMELAKLIYAVLRDQKKTKGKSRLSAMIRSGKELRAFAVKDEDLLKFCRAAKKYGVLYTVLKDKDAKDGVTDVMVRAEDAAKVNRIFERFKLATVDMASVQSEIVPEKESEKTGAEKGKVEKAVEKFKKKGDGSKKKAGAVEEKTEVSEKKAADSGEKESLKTGEKKATEKTVESGEKKAPDPGEKSASSEDKAEAFLEELFGQEEAEKAQRGNPTGGRDQKSRRSESSSKKKETTGRDASDGNSTRHSVKEELKEIRNEQKASPEQQREPSQNREASGKNEASRNQNSKGRKKRKKSGNSRNASQYSGKNNAPKSAAKQMNRSKGARG